MALRRRLAADAPRPKLTKPQNSIYQEGWQPHARFRVAVCGRRFGKTFLGMEEMRRAARMAVQRKIDPDNEIWYGAPTFKQAKRVFWRRLKRAIPARWTARRPNESECSITLITGHVMRIVGLDNYDNLRGSGLWFFLGDEWADAKPEAWNETIRPMLSTAGGHALFIGTPKGYNDFRDKFLLGQAGAVNEDGTPIVGWKSWKYTTIEGGNVPNEEIEAARRSMGAREFSQEYGGNFENYAGRVLFAFIRDENMKPCPLDPKLPIDIGMDFNVNPMSATVWQSAPRLDSNGKPMMLMDRNGKMYPSTWDYQVGEVIIPTSNTDEMCDEIQRRYGRAGGVSHITVFPDPAGAQRRTSAQGRTDITILRDRGFNVVAMSSHPLVRDRNNLVNARFCAADGTRTAFVDPSCVKSIEAYERHVYKDGTSDPDKSTGFDHPVDATGYRFWGRYAYKPAHSAPSTHMGR